MQILDINSLMAASTKLQWAHPGLYFLFDKGECVYVGQSQQNVLARIVSHIGDKQFDAVTVLELWIGADELIQLEAEYIWRLEPYYNTLIPPNPYYLRRGKLKEVLHIGGRRLSKIIAKNHIQPRVNDYYDAREIRPYL